jgi:hypothetical protein
MRFQCKYAGAGVKDNIVLMICTLFSELVFVGKMVEWLILSYRRTVLMSRRVAGYAN